VMFRGFLVMTPRMFVVLCSLMMMISHFLSHVSPSDLCRVCSAQRQRHVPAGARSARTI
jgi:hypothetical protein